MGGFSSPDTNGPVILAVEDNEVNRMVLEFTLEPLAMPVVMSEDGTSGYQKFKDLRPALVLMDISLPGLNGYEVTAAIRQYEQDHGLTRTPIIAMTAHAMKDDRQKCLDAGMDDYISKPISPDHTVATISRWLNPTALSSAALA
ncbi:MAG: response regulator [Rhizobiaceae bacterium]